MNAPIRHAECQRSLARLGGNPLAPSASPIGLLDDEVFKLPQSSPEEMIAEARNGRIFVLIDDYRQVQGGVLVVPGQMATPDTINFLATHGRGLICLALTRDRVEELKLPMMQRRGDPRPGTAFATSIEARLGVSTGISAPDRARTISVAINASSSSDELVTPGHVFPLVAQDGGVLVNAGYAEAAVDVVRPAGLNPSAVICEILNQDGSLASSERILALAADHGCKIGSIAELIAYRRRHDSLIERLAQRSLRSRIGGDWTVNTYVNKIQGDEHLVLYQGDVASGEPVLVRMHTASLFADMFAEQGERTGKLERAMEVIGAVERGVIVILRERSDNPLSQLVLREGVTEQFEIRDYGIAAQILVDLGVARIALLTDEPCNLVAVEGYGLSVVSEQPLSAAQQR